MNDYRRSKHKDIVDDYKKAKSKHLEKLANKMLKNDEKCTKDSLNVIKMAKNAIKII